MLVGVLANSKSFQVPTVVLVHSLFKSVLKGSRFDGHDGQQVEKGRDASRLTYKRQPGRARILCW
jgi:hypothetical protein